MQDRLALTQSPALPETTAHLQRLRDLLARIDLESLARPGGIALHSLRRLTRLIDTPEDLAAARTEIGLLVHLLTDSLAGLLDLRDRLGHHATRLDTMADQVEAAALAASWLAKHASPEHQRSFADRGTSLRATLLQITSARLQLVHDQTLPARLILAVQNIALVALPAWLERLAHLQSRSAPSVTEARELAFRLNHLFPLFPPKE